MSDRGVFRLVDAAGDAGGPNVVAFGEAANRVEAERGLLAEASAFAAVNGKNAYSDFILKYCRRPDPEHAATLGRLVGRQVKASDGTMQPRRTKAQREAWRLERELRRTQKQRREELSRLRRAVEYLAKSEIDPAELIHSIHNDRLKSRLGDEIAQWILER